MTTATKIAPKSLAERLRTFLNDPYWLLERAYALLEEEQEDATAAVDA